MDLVIALIIIFTSFLAGFIGSILGIGGGIIIVPTLTNLGFPIEIVIPASLLAILFNSIVSSVKYSMKKLINFKLGLSLSILIILGAIIGSLTFIVIPKKFLYIIFAIVVIILGYFVLKNKKINLSKNLSYSLFIIGGIISNLLGVGGGILFTPLLHLIFNLELKRAVATSLLMIGIATFMGTIIYLYNGYVDLPLSFLTSLGIILGSYLGSTLMFSIKEEYQRYALVFLLVIVSFSMIYRGINLYIS